jgi:hypothetical protein
VPRKLSGKLIISSGDRTGPRAVAYTETDTAQNRWDFDLAPRAGYARGFYGKAGVGASILPRRPFRARTSTEPIRA